MVFADGINGSTFLSEVLELPGLVDDAKEQLFGDQDNDNLLHVLCKGRRFDHQPECLQKTLKLAEEYF